MNALILVDIQNDFIPNGSLAVDGGDAIIPLVNQLQKSFDLVVATQDWHPQHHKSFASNHPGQKVFDEISIHGLKQVMWPDHCVQGSWGAAFHPGLNMDRVEAIFRKGMDPEYDSYSGFFDNGHHRSTGMAGYLKDRGVQKVYLCGLAGDYCVAFTAKDALKENFKAVVIEDATRSISQEGFRRAKEEIISMGGSIMQSSALT